MAIEFRGEEILYVIEAGVDASGARLLRPFNQTGGSTEISADTIDMESKDKSGADYGKVSQTVSLEGVLTETDETIPFIITAMRTKQPVKIFEVNTRTKEAESGLYTITSFNMEYSNGDFATYSLEGALNGDVAKTMLTTIPGGAAGSYDADLSALVQRVTAAEALIASNTKSIEDSALRIERKTSDFTYNMNSLSKFVGAINPKVVFWGDSITAGAGADAWYTSWVGQFSDTFQLTKGSMFGRGYVAANDAGTPAGWTLETKGINMFRVVSSAASLTVSQHQFADRTIDVLFSKESDGGQFDVKIDGAVIATGDCAGTTSYGNKLTFVVPKQKAFEIAPKGKAYIEGFVHYKLGGAVDGVLVHKVGHGGFSAEQFSDEEIRASIETFNPTLTCIGHITNDIALQTPDLFKSKIQTAITSGKKTGDVLLYIPCRGKDRETSGGLTYPYEYYTKLLYDLADENDCAVIDFDKLMGGYTTAKNNGLLADDVHPNQKGHDLMYREFVRAIVTDSLPTSFKIAHAGGVGNYYDLLIQFPKVLGRNRVESELLISSILKGYSSTTNLESYLQVNKVKVVNDGTADHITLENYGAGAIITMRDKGQPNILQIRNANNKSLISSMKTLEIDTSESDKFANPTDVKNLLVATSGIKIGAPEASKVGANTLFIDADGSLKFKDNGGVVRTVTLT